MNFDCTKPLEDKLELYLKDDIGDICDELCENGIVYESQYKSLWSMICKHNSLEMIELFSRETKLNIFYVYDNVTCNFVYYDTEKYSREEAVQKSVQYQKSHEN